jgi:ubiquinone/menaquinone biosynthesis C-methylase UbiE
MLRELLHYLCDPVTGEPLTLSSPVYDTNGHRILAGTLTGPNGTVYPIINGIPRFASLENLKLDVKSFGDQWNYFNFTDFKCHWLNHTVANTFGSTEVFKGKLIVDAGGGSGAQALWMLESGAKHVIVLELSHSVDDVMRQNLETSGFKNYDIIQCTIDQPPIRDGAIEGIVICHNVIHHTPSVEKTATALFKLVGAGGEFAFNCYPLNDEGLLRWVRFHVIYKSLRRLLRRMPFGTNLAYARTMGVLRMVPVLGLLFEKAGFCMQGDVPKTDQGLAARLRHRYRATVLNTFDWYGSHTYQHHKSDDEIKQLVAQLQPDLTKVLNYRKYFSRPTPIGCALRIFK